MSVKIRLSKVGKKHQISYRLVVQDTRAKRDGKFLEILGFYNPYNNPQFKINQNQLNEWLKKGALPTQAVSELIKVGKLTKKSRKKEPEVKTSPESVVQKPQT